MVRMQEKKKKALSMEDILPKNVRKKFDIAANHGRRLRVIWDGGEYYETIENGYKTYLVHIKNCTCECGQWQVSEIPCRHAVASIQFQRMHPVDYVHPWLKNDAYIQIYDHVINPIPDFNKLPNVEADIILPPSKRVKTERPKKLRKRGATEGESK